MMLYICTKSHENISNGFRVIERTRNDDGRTDKVITIGPPQTSSVKIVDRVMVLVLCTSSDDTLHLYQVS